MKPYFQDDAVTIYHGDCREVLPELGLVDLVLTDPPYGVGKNYGEGSDDTVLACADLWAWLIEIGLPTCFTFSHTRLFDLPRRPQWIGVWYKPFTGGVVSIGCSPSWEPICFYHMPYLKEGYRRWDDVFRCNVEGFPFNRPRNSKHPTPRPTELIRLLLGVMPQGTVLDPFMGSGTTLRAAKDLGRKAIGIEIEEKYCEIAALRMQQATLPLAALPEPAAAQGSLL